MEMEVVSKIEVISMRKYHKIRSFLFCALILSYQSTYSIDWNGWVSHALGGIKSFISAQLNQHPWQSAAIFVASALASRYVLQKYYGNKSKKKPSKPIKKPIIKKLNKEKTDSLNSNQEVKQLLTTIRQGSFDNIGKAYHPFWLAIKNLSKYILNSATEDEINKIIATIQQFDQDHAYQTLIQMLFCTPKLFKSHAIKLPRMVKTVAQSRDGNYIAAGTHNGSVYVYDKQSKKMFKIPCKLKARSLAFHPTKPFLAVGLMNNKKFNTLVIFDIQSLTEPKLVKSLIAHTDDVTALDFSPDGKYLASISDDCTIRTWDVEANWNRIHILHYGPEYGLNISFNADGTSLAAGGYNSTHINVWNTANYKLIFKKDFETKNNTVATFHPKNPHLLAISSCDGIQIIDVQTDTIISRISVTELNKIHPVKNTISFVSFDQSGTKIACRDDKGIISIWNNVLDTPTCNSTITDKLAFHPFCTMVFNNDTLITGFSFKSIGETWDENNAHFERKKGGFIYFWNINKNKQRQIDVLLNDLRKLKKS